MTEPERPLRRSPLEVVLALGGAAALVPLGGAFLVFVSANGATVSAFALAALAALLVLLCFVAPRSSISRKSRRLALAVALLLLVFEGVYIAARLLRASPAGPAVQYCEDGDCTLAPPLLSRLVDEDETALAGLGFASSLGLIRGAEERSLDTLLRASYADLRASPRFAGLPNAALIGAAPGRVRFLAWVPPRKPNAPCLVFLHGFGGQLSVYLQEWVDGGLGDEFAIVAPFLDADGAWWSPEGEAVVRGLVERSLPASVDRTRVFLVGLSNGAIGAVRLAARPEMRRLFRGVVLLSGSAEVQGADLTGLDLLVITGAQDPRFPLSGIEEHVASLRAGGAQALVEVVPGDHFVALREKREVEGRMRAWLGPRAR
ncbi:hypothetical protein [Polyangium aurulentum]|uniref:hypothetical protein n=1 Tax=Polyangium aurulentum TaxID=2567896 RepID=UPI0010ADAC7F|nr:hypothetical protein [Polyangium aurulentum]UQA55862.1 hypothetical protein E8A73_031610 [Polyangium aurulentum]